MLKRFIAVAVLCVSSAAGLRAADIESQIFPLSGEIRFRNPSAAPLSFVYYSIESPSGALDPTPATWRSISAEYDVSGNGFIDPAFNWTKISAVPTELTEGAFAGPGGSLAAFRSFSLGHVWDSVLYPLQDLTFTVLQADMTPLVVTVAPSVAGDYDGNGIVNGLDYNVWRQTFGSTTNLDADGNLNGIVDAADYVIYRDHFGLSLPGSGSGSGLQVGSAAVPEPGTATLFAGIFVTSFFGRAARRPGGRAPARRP